MARPERGGAVPTEEEVVAILAAVEAAWPRPVVVADERPQARPWRWSGRWWAAGKPSAADRRRPLGQ